MSNNPLNEFLNNNEAKNEAAPVAAQDIKAKKRALIKKIVIIDLLLVPVIIFVLFFFNSETSDYNSLNSKAGGKTLHLPSIEKAYELTHVERVKYDSTLSKLSYDEKMYFEQLFRITDKMVPERIYNYWATDYKMPLRNLDIYNDTILELQALKPPAKGREAHALIVSVIRDQRDYYKFLADSKSSFNANNPLVQRSHQNLLTAWQLWLAAFENESAHNKTAFEKHLCALDFI
jgi:hypothetical protein